ncbi:MAG: 50S ribosomal protein L16 [archaeon]|nr:50S ribosomal protein L16 [archaeon]MCR4323610.1 50S ribosomal protein L16 [Nanoarchaeota archaeon]
MALRKASAYSKNYALPYTRKSKTKSKSYIKTIPNSKIVRFKMGDIIGFDGGKYSTIIKIKSKERCQIRDNSIEAVRQYLNRFLQTKMGKDFYLEVKIYPHHVLRENKMITGAGADRMQTGMARSFGKTVGRAALVVPEQVLFIVGVKLLKHEIEARKLISAIKARLPCKVGTETFRAKP